MARPLSEGVRGVRHACMREFLKFSIQYIQVRNGQDDFYEDDGDMQRHVARVAYERSKDFIEYAEEVALPAEVAASCQSDFKDDFALVVAQNQGLRDSLEVMLR